MHYQDWMAKGQAKSEAKRQVKKIKATMWQFFIFYDKLFSNQEKLSSKIFEDDLLQSFARRWYDKKVLKYEILQSRETNDLQTHPIYSKEERVVRSIR